MCLKLNEIKIKMDTITHVLPNSTKQSHASPHSIIMNTLFLHITSQLVPVSVLFLTHPISICILFCNKLLNITGNVHK